MNDRIKQELLIRRLKMKRIDNSLVNRKKSRDTASYGNRPKMNKVNIRSLINNKKRIFSPTEQRHHALGSIDNTPI